MKDWAETSIERQLFADLEYRRCVLDYTDTTAVLTEATSNTYTANLKNNLDAVLKCLELERVAQTQQHAAALRLIDTATRVLTVSQRDASIEQLISSTVPPRLI